MRILFKTMLWIIIFAIGITALTAYVVADTFFIEHPIDDDAVVTRKPRTTTAAVTTAAAPLQDTAITGTP